MPGKPSSRTNPCEISTGGGHDPLGQIQKVDEYVSLSATTPDRTTQFRYDPRFGNVSWVSLPLGTGTIRYTYNDQGQPARTTSSFEHEIEYEYDELGRLKVVELDPKAAVKRSFTVGHDLLALTENPHIPGEVHGYYHYDGPELRGQVLQSNIL